MFDEDEAAFHRAILDRPGDLANILIYADWLEERGAMGWATLLRATPKMTVRVRPAYYAAICDHRCRREYILTARSPYDQNVPATWIAVIDVWIDHYPRGGYRRQLPRFRVCADGTSPDNDKWWGWLLALALAHGWRMPDPVPA